MARQQDFISEARQHARLLWEAINALEGLQKEWNALDYSNTLTDGEGENDKLTRLHIGSVVFDTANAVRTVLDTGHATNIARLL